MSTKKTNHLMVGKSTSVSTVPTVKKSAPTPTEAAVLEESSSIRVLKQAQTTKLSPKAPGLLTYAIGLDDQNQTLFIKLVSNSSDGYFSQEWVPMATLRRCLEAVNANEVFPATLFKSAFISRSQNNPGFLAAVLKQEGLVSKSTDRVHGLTYDPEDWLAWETRWRKSSTAAVSNSEEESVLDQVMLTD